MLPTMTPPFPVTGAARALHHCRLKRQQGEQQAKRATMLHEALLGLLVTEVTFAHARICAKPLKERATKMHAVGTVDNL